MIKITVSGRSSLEQLSTVKLWTANDPCQTRRTKELDDHEVAMKLTFIMRFSLSLSVCVYVYVFIALTDRAPTLQTSTENATKYVVFGTLYS